MTAATPEIFDLAVIGGGPAGVTAALRASELGARVALVERDRPGCGRRWGARADPSGSAATHDL